MRDNATLSLDTWINLEAAAHTSLTILLHVTYSKSSYGALNCYTHDSVININSFDVVVLL